MSISIPTKPLIPKSDSYSLDIRAAISGLSGKKEDWPVLASVLGQIQSSNNRLEKAIRSASDNTFGEIIVRDATGKLIGWIGSRAPYFGAWFQQLYVGANGPDTAPLFADVSGNVIIGKNGSLSLQDGGGNSVGWLGVQADSPKTITGATNATPIVITSNAHGYENGDTVYIANVGGNTAANGYRIVKNKAANTFEITDLSGTNVAGNGAYTTGGTSTRYFGGGRFQTIAIGTSFTNYKLRAYADGQLKIKDALITLTDTTNNGYIELNPSNGPTSVFRNTATGAEIKITGGIIYADNYITPAQSWSMGSYFIVGTNSTSNVVATLSIFAGYGSLSLSDATGVSTIGLNGSTGTISGTNADVTTAYKVGGTTVIDSARVVNGSAYKVGGTPGVSTSGTYVTTVTATTGSAITSVDFATPATTSGTFVTGITVATVSRAWTSGLLTT